MMCFRDMGLIIKSLNRLFKMFCFPKFSVMCRLMLQLFIIPLKMVINVFRKNAIKSRSMEANY